MSDGLPQVQVQRVAVSSKFLTGQLSGRYSAKSEGPGVIDMTGNLAQVVGPEGWRHVPLVIAEPVRAWMHRAIGFGTARDVRVQLRGDLRHFPWKHGDGVFEAAGNYTDGTVAFANGWHRIEGLQGRITFRGTRLEITANAGGVFGAKLFSASVVIPDLDAP